MKLNRETGTYVYNLIAMKAIIDHPQNYGYRQSLAYLQPKDQLLTNSTVL